MTRTDHDNAARFLFAARQSGTPGARLPAEWRPADAADALAIQACVTALVGQRIGGYKCSMPTQPRPVSYGPIYAPAILADSPYPVPGATTTARIEPEIAFVLAHDLPPRSTPYSEDDVRAAVGQARFALEIIGTRYADPGSVTFPELLADNVANQGLFMGPILKDPWSHELDAFPLTVSTTDGMLITRTGAHPDGHPLRPLHWLANHLAARGEMLAAGTVVTTGSYCGLLDVPLATPLTFTYGDLGSLAVTLTKG